jgi:hypothetical protein
VLRRRAILNNMAIWNTKEKNGMWKGGRSVASNGYVLVRVGKGHHLADVRGYAYEHRVVAEIKLGRKLKAGEQIHHLNGNKADNRKENIEVESSRFSHAVKHRKVGFGRRLPGQKNPKVFCGCGCGESFSVFDNSGRPRCFVSGHNLHN